MTLGGPRLLREAQLGCLLLCDCCGVSVGCSAAAAVASAGRMFQANCWDDQHRVAQPLPLSDPLTQCNPVAGCCPHLRLPPVGVQTVLSCYFTPSTAAPSAGPSFVLPLGGPLERFLLII